jgi:hypothetical protein
LRADTSGQIRDVQLCGTLDDKLQETLLLVSRIWETTAARCTKNPILGKRFARRIGTHSAKDTVEFNFR